MASKGSGNLPFVYAEALHDVATEAGTVTETEEQVFALRDLLEKDAKIRLFFESPAIEFDVKRKAVEQGMASFSPIMRNFMLLVIENDRFALMDRICQAFHRHCNEEAGIAEFELRTAAPLEAAEKEKLKQTLEAGTKRKVVLVEKVRPELLGGFVLTHEDRQWDTSLVHRLGRLVERMENAKEALGVWGKE